MVNTLLRTIAFRINTSELFLFFNLIKSQCDICCCFDCIIALKSKTVRAWWNSISLPSSMCPIGFVIVLFITKIINTYSIKFSKKTYIINITVSTSIFLKKFELISNKLIFMATRASIFGLPYRGPWTIGWESPE